MPFDIATVNFTSFNSYWEKERDIELAEKENIRLEKENAKLSHIKPLEAQINKLKPIVDDLSQKDEHRMRELGLHPDYKYYKGGDNDE